MLFTSLEFCIFFCLVLFLYWKVFNRNILWQNVVVLLASYLFYGWWDWRFLTLIALSTIVDFFIGLKVGNESRSQRKKWWLWLSIGFNLCLLAFFKYFEFFIDSFIDLFAILGYPLDSWSLKIILPVGISFYTFQSMSYTLDVYKGRIKPTNNFIAFAAFVSFFPQLVAGPIERAKNMLPQFFKPRIVTNSDCVVGLHLVLIGFFKKVVIADSLAPFVNKIFSNYSEQSGLTLALGAVYFAIQIYADFSGYSNIARGLARWMGFRLMVNFNFPYFSRNIGEFWRRWHISLSTWFRDYLYIPIGGSKGGKWFSIRNIFIIFIISGLWHGANWTFVTWGLFHALLFIPSFLMRNNRRYNSSLAINNKSTLSINTAFQILFTFLFVTFGWILFRADNINHAIEYISRMVTHSWLTGQYYYGIALVFLMVLIDVILAKKKDKEWVYYILVGAIFAALFSSSPSEFIYFQF
ncbi:MAG: MBOAT family O-acyltransferase [Saprospiraceae bacterium]